MSAVYAIGATSLTGGGTGALDAEYVDANGVSPWSGAGETPGIHDGDPAFVTVQGDKVYHYIANATSGATESSPDVIKPDESSAGVPYTGQLRWILHNVYGVDQEFTSAEKTKLAGLYAGAGTFNGTTGDVITIGATLGGTAYHVAITPTGDSLNVGAIYVDTKTTTQFTVKCTGTGVPAFDWMIMDI